MDFSDHETPPIPRDPTRLTLGEEWTEGHFETGKWGPTNKPGIDATFECGRSDSGSSIRIFPLRYERQGRRETIHGITSDTRAEEHSDKVSQLPEVTSMTAFGVHLTYSPIGGPDLTYYTVAADAGDALAVACWLSQYTTDGSMFEGLVYTHEGTDPSDYRDHQPDDEDRVDAAFAEQPERCLFKGQKTQSHLIDIPYRYGPLLDGFPKTYQDVPCVPPDISSLVGVISHSAWKKHDLSNDLFTESVNRVTAGEYTLDGDAVDILQDRQADSVAVRRLGED